VHQLRFDSKTFDVVVANFGVQHFADLPRAFKEVSRVLRQGGRFAFTVWADADLNVAAGILDRALSAHASKKSAIPPGPSYSVLCNAESQRDLLSEAGFDRMSVTAVPVRFDWKIQDADRLFWSEFHGSVRSGAQLREQNPSEAMRIREAMALEIEMNCRSGDEYVVPMAAYVVSATKP
jgi:SAM-dependent methyltransferase